MDKRLPNNTSADNLLKSEIMLQINQRLFEQGMITRELYEGAKTKLVSPG